MQPAASRVGVGHKFGQFLPHLIAGGVATDHGVVNGERPQFLAPPDSFNFQAVALHVTTAGQEHNAIRHRALLVICAPVVQQFPVGRLAGVGVGKAKDGVLKHLHPFIGFLRLFVLARAIGPGIPTQRGIQRRNMEAGPLALGVLRHPAPCLKDSVLVVFFKNAVAMDAPIAGQLRLVIRPRHLFPDQLLILTAQGAGHGVNTHVGIQELPLDAAAP